MFNMGLLTNISRILHVWKLYLRASFDLGFSLYFLHVDFDNEFQTCLFH